MTKILVSACLVGEHVRHDGGAKTSSHDRLAQWIAEGRVVPVCPEVAGGLPVPRPAAEVEPGFTGADVLAGRACIRRKDGIDVTVPFRRGAEHALAEAHRNGVRLAVLKQSSPSCGSRTIHDGTFAGVKKSGEGLTTAVLRAAGIHVIGEDELDALDD